MALSILLRGLVDLLAPPTCVACDEPLEPGEQGFCPLCGSLLDRLGGAGAEVAAFGYGGPLATAIVRFKHHGRSELARPLAARMLEPARAKAVGLDAIVPVPLHSARLRHRGYDQTSLLARSLSSSLGIPTRLDLLHRARPTTPQVRLDRRGRLENVAGAFVASPRARGLGLLVLDDVRTTGATLADACRALLLAGARQVRPYALSLAEYDERDVVHEERG